MKRSGTGIKPISKAGDVALEKPYGEAAGFKAETIPALFLERCRRTPDRVAFKWKDLGLYKEVSWREYLQHVESFCIGLKELGLEKGDTVAIMGDPCPEWIYADIAAQSAGAITYGIYTTSSIEETKWMMENGGAKFFVAEDQESADKVLAVADELPALKKIIVADTRAMFMYDDPRITTFSEVKRIGAERAKMKPGVFEELVSQAKPEDVATLVYTSGTTGVPKGVMITHYNLLWCRLGTPLIFPEYFFDEKAKSVAYLPLAHVLARFQDEYFPLLDNHITHFGEEVELMAETLFEVSPTIFLGAPRTLEKFAAQVVVGMQNSTWLKKAIYDVAMKIGRRYTRERWEERDPLAFKILYAVARLLVFRPLLDKIGFSQVKFAMIGGAPVPPETIALWHIWGVSVREMYGQTEGTNISVQRIPFSKPGSAGPVFPRIEWRINPDGELLVRAPGSFPGYWRDEEATRKVKDADGWVHTGDIIEVSKEGEMKVVDRLKDIQITAGGKNIPPSLIEKALKASPYISEAIVFADGRKFPSALIEIDFDTVSEWARSQGILYTGFTSLATHPKVYKLINQEIGEANQRLARVEQVKRFRIIPKEFDPEDENDPVTSTRKIKRNAVYERFSELVESMYVEQLGEKERILVELGELKGELTSKEGK